MISLEMDRNGQEWPSEAPERIQEDKYQGGGVQAGNEAMQRAAAGSAAWRETGKIC